MNKEDKPGFFFSMSDIEQIKSRFQDGWYREAYEKLLERADFLTENDSPALDVIAKGHGGGTSARQLEYKTGILALAGYLSGNETYLKRGVQVYLNTIKTTHLDDFIRFNGHLCVGDAARAEAISYDLLCPYLSDEEKEYALSELTHIGAWLYESPSAWGRPHKGVMSCNHNSVHFGGLGLAALVLGEHEDWLACAVEKVRAYFYYSTDKTGFITEGLGYGGYGLLAACTFAEAYRRMGGEDLAMENEKTGLIPRQLLAQSLPNLKGSVSLNDNAGPLGNLSGYMYLISRYKDAAALYMLQKMTGRDGDGNYGGAKSGSMGGGISLPVMLLWSDPAIQPKTPEEIGLPLSFCFESGRIFARSAWEDRDASFMFFTSGWDMHRGHNHCDQNSFAFYAMDEDFLIDPEMIPNRSESHNIVMIDGEGQGLASHGEIIEFEDRGRSVFVAGDATEAYDWSKNIVGYARRNVLYVRGENPYLVVFDDIQTEDDKEKEYTFLMHTIVHNKVEITDERSLLITGNHHGHTCRLRFVNPGDVNLCIDDLNGKETFRYGATHKLEDFYKEASAKTRGLSPNFVTVITAVEAGKRHPEIISEGDYTNMSITIRFADGKVDKIRLDQYNIRLYEERQ